MSGEKAKGRTDDHYRRIYALFLPVFRIVARATYGVRVKKPRHYDEPVLILANHTSDMDFVVVASHISNHMYFVASEHVTAMGLFGKGFRAWFDPITVTKGASKTGGVMDIMRRLRRGNCVLLFCEGRLSHDGRSTYIAPATAKLAKSVKCRVVTFRSSGGFFIEPRWQNYLNRGRLFSSGIVHEYSRDEVAAMSNEEMLEHIREDLYVDAYAEQRERMQPFKFKHGIRDITCYYDVCPHCGGIDTLRAEGMEARCGSCGYLLRCDEYGFFHGSPQLISTVQDWEELQLETYRREFEAGRFFREEGVTLYELGEHFALKVLGTAELVSSADGLSIGGHSFSFRDMSVPELLSGGRRVEFSAAGKDYMLEKENACLNKYLELRRWSLERAKT